MSTNLERLAGVIIATEGSVTEHPAEPEFEGIDEAELARIRLGSDGGLLCDY